MSNPPVVVRAILQARVLAGERDLTCDRLQQRAIAGRIGLLGFLLTEHEQSDEVTIAAAHRDDEAHAGLAQPRAIG